MAVIIKRNYKSDTELRIPFDRELMELQMFVPDETDIADYTMLALVQYHDISVKEALGYFRELFPDYGK